jgi:uncharacterized protein (TIGR03437 family)
MISVFGTHLAQPPASATYNEIGLYPTSLAGTTVTFSGISAPLLYISQGQINALVPYGIAGQKTADVVVTRVTGTFSQSSGTFTISLMDTSPGLFTATQNGSGQAAILEYPDSVYNSTDHPAYPGSVITLFATGMGVWDPPVPDGGIDLFDFSRIPPQSSFLAKPVSLTIGGQPARILYTGASPYQVWGLLQINAVVPDNVASGVQPVVLKIGQNDNSSQNVTMAIK